MENQHTTTSPPEIHQAVAELRAIQVELDTLYEETAQEVYEARVRHEKYAQELHDLGEEIEEESKKDKALWSKIEKESGKYRVLREELEEKMVRLELHMELRKGKGDVEEGERSETMGSQGEAGGEEASGSGAQELTRSGSDKGDRIIFAGALLGFVLARLQYLSIDGEFSQSAAPGEWYWMHKGFRRVGVTLHPATILPASLLVILQFVPIIRYKALVFHRTNGHTVILLLILSNIGALMIARHSVGGEFETQVLVGLLAILSTLGIFLALYNIKRLQIDQHRSWMLRTWFCAASIIRLRLILFLSSSVLTHIGGYHRAMSCYEIAFILDDPSQFQSSYPQCFTANGTVDGYIALPAALSANGAQAGNSLDMTFGTAG